MNTIFGVYVSKEVRSALKGGLAMLIYRQKQISGGGPLDPDGGQVTYTDYKCEGFFDSYSAYEIANTLIEGGDKKVIIIADSLAIEPQSHDMISNGQQSFNIVNIDADPTKSIYEMQVR